MENVSHSVCRRQLVTAPNEKQLVGSGCL